MPAHGFAINHMGVGSTAGGFLPRAYTVTIDVASVAANTTAEQTFTVTGLNTDDAVMVSKPSLDAGLGIANARVSAKDTLALTFVNPTAGAIDPSSEEYKVIAIKCV